MAARQIIDEETHAGLVQLHVAVGEKQARRILGDLSPEAYARALARLTQHAATVELVRARLRDWREGVLS